VETVTYNMAYFGTGQIADLEEIISDSVMPGKLVPCGHQVACIGNPTYITDLACIRSFTVVLVFPASSTDSQNFKLCLLLVV